MIVNTTITEARKLTTERSYIDEMKMYVLNINIETDNKNKFVITLFSEEVIKIE